MHFFGNSPENVVLDLPLFSMVVKYLCSQTDTEREVSSEPVVAAIYCTAGRRYCNAFNSWQLILYCWSVGDVY
jgi:hypothetical protein